MKFISLLAAVTFTFVAQAQTESQLPELKLQELYLYRGEVTTTSINFGSDLAYADGMLYISARGNNGRFVDAYNINEDGSLTFAEKQFNSNINMYGWSIAASDNCLAVAASTGKAITIYPKDADPYVFNESDGLGATSAVDMCNDELLITSNNGIIGIYKVESTQLKPLLVLTEYNNINAGTKPAISEKIAAFTDRTNKQVVICEKADDGQWTVANNIAIPNATANIFAVCIADNKVIVGDRGNSKETKGNVYSIEKIDGVWTIKQTIESLDENVTTFGNAIAYDNGHMVVICNYGSNTSCGNAYVYGLNAEGLWIPEYIIKNSGSDLKLGSTVCMIGDNIYISQYNTINISEGSASGGVYHYVIGKTAEQTPTAIPAIKEKTNSKTYNLAGCEVKGDTKGLVIKDRKIIWVK